MKLILGAIGLLCVGLLPAQPGFYPLRNPSFEDPPGHSRAPHAWFFCNFPGETPPDIHPIPSLRVTIPPKRGETFVGMVTRPNGSYERIGQQLQQPLLAGNHYQLQIHVARSPHYRSYNRLTLRPLDYNTPVVLRVQGGGTSCDTNELLAQTQPIDWEEWRLLTLNLRPQSDISFLSIGAYFEQPDQPTAGHLLIDDLGPICLVSDHRPHHRALLEVPPPPEETEGLLAWTRQTLGPRINELLLKTQNHIAVFKDDDGALLQGAREIYQLWMLEKRVKTKQTLEIGIRVRQVETFRQLQTSFDLLCRELGKDLQRVKFRQIRSLKRNHKWDYADQDQLIWLRWKS